MKAVPMLTAFMLFFLAWQPASAEFYRYVDKHGNVLYTDDLSNIPADQREAAKPFEEYSSAAKTPTASPVPQEPASDQQTPPSNDANLEWQKLNEEREKLDKEYIDLKQQREALDEAKAKAVTPEQRKRYNEQIVKYNTRASALQEKYDAHDAKVKAFNESAKAKPPAEENK